MAAIELERVSKRFGDIVAVDDVELTIQDGEIFGFLGPNGAGKSTTINMLLGFVRPSAGTIRVLGMDAQAETVAVRRRTGVLPEGFGVYNRLTGRQHVDLAIESMDASDDPAAILERVGLEDDINRKVGGYSKGMRQRLALGMALVGDPDLLILDEPSTGLDPAGAKEMRQIVREEADRGATVFFSSHVLGQVEAVCDRVGIMRAGQLIAEDSIDGLRSAVGGDERLTIEVADVSGDVLDQLRSLEGVSRVTGSEGTITVVGTPGAKTAVIQELQDAGARVNDFQTESASLEEVFLAYTEDGQASAAASIHEGPDETTSAESGVNE
ncbi:MAG: ATP-binding cassette domain-containing protein [Halanaeroarchaeum sp.]